MRTPVINNKEALVIGQLPASGKEPGPIVVFLPGLNLVDSKQLAVLRNNKNFDAHFKTLIPPSLAPEQTPEKVGKPILELAGKELEDASPLAKLDKQACKLLISETLDAPMLDSWLMEETRADIARSINEQKVKIGSVANSLVAGR